MTGMRYFCATLTIFTTSSVEVGYTTMLCGSPAHNQHHDASNQNAKVGAYWGDENVAKTCVPPAGLALSSPYPLQRMPWVPQSHVKRSLGVAVDRCWCQLPLHTGIGRANVIQLHAYITP